MSDDAVARGRRLEAEGDVDGAAREYVAGGAYGEAARVLTSAVRPIDAALALLGGIDMISADAPPEARERMRVAASLLREGDREEHARLITTALAGGTAFPAAVLKSTAPSAASTSRPSIAPSVRGVATPDEASLPSASPAAADASRSSASRLTRPRTVRPVAAVEAWGPASRGSVRDARTDLPDADGREASESARRPSAPPAHAHGAAPTNVSEPAPRPDLAPPSATPRAGASPNEAATDVTSGPPAAGSRPPTEGGSIRGPASPTTPGPDSTASRSPPESGPRAPRLAAHVGRAEPSDEKYRAEGGWRVADAATTERAIRQFLEAGRKGAAARVAWEAGQHARALEWFLELGLNYQAGACLRALGRPDEALATLLAVPPEDSRYRRACFDIVALARELGRLDFEVDRFLTSFVAEGPRETSECSAYLDLAEHYAAAGFTAGARRCAEGVLRLLPGDERAMSFIQVVATRRARGSERPARSSTEPQVSLSLPSLEEFTALAKQHAPRPAARR